LTKFAQIVARNFVTFATNMKRLLRKFQKISIIGQFKYII